LQRALASTLDDALALDALVALTMQTGKAGVDVMALLDKANTSRYGSPEMTKVNLGVKNIRLGPTLPAFLSPNVTNLLVSKFGIAGIGTVDDDIKLLG
jgi:hydroxylamine reductase (hybrid-cluster protein)